jgi:eukaryotic-like serine/threonine-protein kinase
MNPVSMSNAAQEYCKQREIGFLGELGRGAFKCAFLIDVAGARAALKIADLSKGSVDRLMRETEAIQACDHASIAKIHHAEPFSCAGENYWVVMEEYLAGGSLEQRMAKENITNSEVRRIGLCLADVISHLQEKKLVHRDIKPANILFRENNSQPVLTDFGIVRMLDSPSLTQDFLGQGPGTPFYAAPEQLNNDKALIDWRTDQFGLAIVLSHCLLGQHPFQEIGASAHDAISTVASRGTLPNHNRESLDRLGFAALIRAMNVWPIGRYRRPTDFISAMAQ